MLRLARAALQRLLPPDRPAFTDPRFRAEVHTRGGKEVVTFGALARQSAGGAQTVAMDLPASALSTGDYEIALKGLRDGDAPQNIGYYYFRIQKQ